MSEVDEATGTANGSRKASITFPMKRMGSSDGWKKRDFVRQNPRSPAFVRTLSRMEKRSQKLLPERRSERETDTRGETVGNGEKKEKSNRGGMRAAVYCL